MKTIILAHPWHGSFNKAILDTLVKRFETNNQKYKIIDLYKDNFQASITEEELSKYNTGTAIDKQVLEYQEIIKNTSEIFFIFPIWWGTMPAILKGFFDRVMLFNYAFNYNNGWTPLLDINTTTVITTSQADKEIFENNIQNGFINLMLNSIGMKNGKWFNLENITKTSKEENEAFFKILIENI